MPTRFVVDLGNVKLTERTAKQIEASVQSAALSALAEIDYRGDLIARFPRGWLGLWIDIGRNLSIEDKEIIEFTKGASVKG